LLVRVWAGKECVVLRMKDSLSEQRGSTQGPRI
jgi:hypothetical protein